MTATVRFFEFGRYWVQSASRPDLEHLVDFTENTPAGACSCEDYQARHAAENRRSPDPRSRCRHLRAALPSLLRDMINQRTIVIPRQLFEKLTKSRDFRNFDCQAHGCQCGRERGCLVRVCPEGDQSRYVLIFAEAKPRFEVMAEQLKPGYREAQQDNPA